MGQVDNLFALLDGGTTSVPQDQSQSAPAAVLPAVDGGYFTVPGLGTAAGTFSIANLPVDAGYLLAMPLSNSTEFDVSNTGGVPDLNFVTLGSSTAVPVTGPLPVSIDLTGLQAVSTVTAEYIELIGANDNVFDFGLQTQLTLADGGPDLANTAPLADGGTSTANYLTGFVDWSQVNAPNSGFEIDPTQGDTLSVAQLVVVDAGDNGATIANVLVGFRDPTGASISAAASSNSIAGALVPVTPDTTLALSLVRRPPSAADLPTGSALSYITLDVSVLPGTDTEATSFGAFAATADLLYAFALPSAATTPVAFNTTYANPYPTGWPVLATIEYSYSLPLTLANGGGTTSAALGWYFVDRVGSLPASYAPGISPPRALTVNGQPTTATLTAVGKQPRLGWTAPAVGTATNYVVAIAEVDPNGGGAPFNFTIAYVTLPGAATELVLPSGVLNNANATATSQFYAVVTAYNMPGRDLTTAPFLVTLPQETAASATSLFSP